MTSSGGRWQTSWAKRLGQTVVVENRPGAGTVVGTQVVIQSPADGYTLLVGGLSNIVFNVGLYNKPSYDPLKDLVPVALVFNISYTLIGSKTCGRLWHIPEVPALLVYVGYQG